MNDPGRVVVVGPLAAYADGVRVELERHGYTSGSAAAQLQVMAQLSRWMADQGLRVSGLTSRRVEQFFELRRTKVRVKQLSANSVRVMLGHLEGLGVLPDAEPMQPTSADLLLARYCRFLLQERAFAARTVSRYRYVAERFLASCSAHGADVDQIDAATVTAFVTAECRSCSNGWAKCVCTAFRSWLKFLYLEDVIQAPLTGVVPTAAGWRVAALPKALASAQLSGLLACCDRATTVGLRDYAVMVLAARLGLRAGEIAGLQLTDINWLQGEMRIRGKGNRVDVLPVPADVGDALERYIRGGRPAVGGAVFQAARAPRRQLAPLTISGIVYRACDRAGLPRIGAHRLRHTAATQMLRAGASLPEIAEVLRHRSPNTTALYAKLDHRTLSALARPWPAGAE